MDTRLSVRAKPVPVRLVAVLAVPLVLAAALTALALALWLVPPLLPSGQFRGAIAAWAGARLGQPVAIGGRIRLRLLPSPMLTAEEVSMPDAGDGRSGRAATAKLLVAPWPLLGGRVVVRDLVLGRPVLTLPWPIRHRSAPTPTAPGASKNDRAPPSAGFAVTVEDGTLRVGAIAATGIFGRLWSEPEAAPLRAEGTARVLGRDWHVGARVGPWIRGLAALDLAVDRRQAQDTGATLHAELAADGTWTGQVAGRGRDLSWLLPAPPVAWTASGPLTASGGLIAAPDLALRLGGSPAQGSFVLRFGADPRLAVALDLGRLDLGVWAPVLEGASSPAAPTWPVTLALTAQAARWHNGTLRNLRAQLAWGGGARLGAATALLPGGATLSLQGAGTRSDPFFHARLAAPDLRQTLRWAWPDLAAALPPTVAREADLAGELRIGPGQFAVAALAGIMDGDPLHGGFTASLQAGRPRLQIALDLDRLALADWTGVSPGEIAQRAAVLDATVHLHVGQVVWPGIAAGPAHLDASTGAGGIVVDGFGLEAAGLHAKGAGGIAPDGRVSGAHLSVAAADARMVLEALPPAWRVMPGLWHGPAAAEIAFAGPPAALSVQARADLADARLELDATIDAPGRAVAGTVTLRHPGAPRLLRAAGMTDPQSWLDDGSLSLLSHFRLAPGRLTIADFDLTAAVLRASGSLAFDLTGAAPVVTGAVRADSLALPAWSWGSAPWRFLAAAPGRGWRATVRVAADQVLVGLRPELSHVAAEFGLADGVLAARGLVGDFAGGHVAGGGTVQLADPPRLALQGVFKGVAVQTPLLGYDPDLAGGVMDATIAVRAEGYDPAAWLTTLSGNATADIAGARLSGVDLGAVAAALSRPRARVAAGLRQALSGGVTEAGQGHVVVALAGGVARFGPGWFVGPFGTLTLSGDADLPSSSLDITLGASPAVPNPPLVTVRLVGPASHPRRVLGLAPGMAWAAMKHARGAS